MEMPGRTTGTADRYGFNGKEKDQDISILTAYDYGFRIYNPGIGRFLSVDPLCSSFSWNSPYCYAEGDPINFKDVDGLEITGEPEVSVPRPTLPELEIYTNLSVSRNGVLYSRNGTVLFENGPINSGAYAPQMRFLTPDEFYAQICPHCGFSMDPDGKGGLVWNSNATWHISLLKEVTPTQPITWVDRLIANQFAETQRLLSSPYKIWNNKGFFEYVTTDFSKLSDEYLEEVNKRIEGGIPTFQDLLYSQEVQRRKADGRIGMKYENPGTHDPTSPKFNRTKSVLPENHNDLFKHSVLGKDGNRWTKVGKGKKAVYHRFMNSGNNTWHWTGSTNGKRMDGKDEKIPETLVPVEIRRINE